MSQVQTITGVMDSADIGWTLSHEHLVSGMGTMERTGLYDEVDALRRCNDALQVTYDAQIRTIIDCTPVDLGRQVSAFQSLAET